MDELDTQRNGWNNGGWLGVWMGESDQISERMNEWMDEGWVGGFMVFRVS